jgi:hypothetical protein
MPTWEMEKQPQKRMLNITGTNPPKKLRPLLGRSLQRRHPAKARNSCRYNYVNGYQVLRRGSEERRYSFNPKPEQPITEP